MKTDLELAYEFFERLSAAGFEVQIEDYEGRAASDHEFDGFATSFGLVSTDGVFAQFDFLGFRFHRVSAHTHGFWNDEADGKKYG